MSADTLARAYSGFLTYLAQPAVRSLLIGGVAAAALWAFRVRRVGTRLLVWTSVLCAALAMPLLGSFLPRVGVAVPAPRLVKSLQASFERGAMRAVPQDAAASHAAVNSVATTMDASAAGAREARDAFVVYAAPRHGAKRAAAGGALDKALGKGFKWLNKTLDKTANKPLKKEFAYGGVRAPVDFSLNAATARVVAPVAQKSSAAGSIASIARRAFAIPSTAIVLGIYLLGAALLFARLLIGVCFSARLSRAAQNIDDREALRLLRFRAGVAGLAAAPQLKESAALAVPATVGVRRAVILLPANWRAWSEEQLDAILAHEISHVARRDALVQMLSLVHRAIFWFSPLGWWLDKQLTDLAEQASDEAALAGGADRARYAETLLGFFAQLGAAPGRVWWQGVSMAKAAKAGSAERRVDRILAWRAGMSMKKSFALAVIALAAPVVFFAASVHPFIANAQDKPPVPPQNVILPGGPVAPVLPKAPKDGVKGGVNAPALPPAPQAGVAAPAKMGAPPAVAPVLPKGPTDGVAALPNIGAAPVAPAALSGPRMVRPSQVPATPPATPRAEGDSGAVATAARVPGVPDAAIGAGEIATAARVPGARGVAIGSGELATAAPMAGYAASTPLASYASSAPLPPQQEAHAVTINGSYSSYGGGRYVMMIGSGDGNNVEMSGDDEDFHHAKELRKKLGTDLIWFERDEKSYVITDPAFIAKAKALFAPEDALSKQQDELSRQQDALSKQQDDLSNQQDNVKVKVPDISPDIKRVQDELEALRQNGATQSELGRLQSELGRLQSRMGGFQSEAGAEQSKLGAQQGELGRQQGELGRKQGELGRQQSEIARKASLQLRGMFDDAIASGIAKPE